MRKRLLILLAAAALVVPSAAAFAEPGGGKGGKGGQGDDKDNSCPESSPNPGREPAPGCGRPGDRDADGVPDSRDNCPDAANPQQEDEDDNGVGDACDTGGTPPADRDEDGDPDNADNCPDAPNPGQEDTDGDGTGDACDPDTTADACDDPEDEGLTGEGTIGEQLADNGLVLPPLSENPEGDGAVTGQIKEGGDETEGEVLTDEIACLGDFLVAEGALPIDP